jgi:hypothetical protein
MLRMADQYTRDCFSLTKKTSLTWHPRMNLSTIKRGQCLFANKFISEPHNYKSHYIVDPVATIYAFNLFTVLLLVYRIIFEPHIKNYLAPPPLITL